MSVFQWAVIGAGPAGITAVGKLLDIGVPAADILWLDPNFKVGDLGLLWSNLSSNTRVQTFIQFLQSLNSFAIKGKQKNFKLFDLAAEDTCLLQYIVTPLQWITDNFIQQVTVEQTMVRNLTLTNRNWILNTDHGLFKASKVIIATGAVPLNLNYQDVDSLPFEIAIDKEKLKKNINKDHSYAVFGSSHSAIMIIRNLVELKVKKIINFYKSPCRYAVFLDTWTLFDNTGLKGETAAWAREHIDGKLPHNLRRYISNEQHIAHYLPECDKIIYAVGFEKRHNLVIGDFPELYHNPYVGIIAPGLFGFGIAYPELKTDPFGNKEPQVGLWKFIQYLERVMPLWIQYST